MWSTSKREAAKRLAPILQKETTKTMGTEWLRYRKRIEKITTFISGFELTDEQIDQLKSKMSEETSKQLRRDSVCKIKAMDVRRDKSFNLTLMKKSEEGKFVLDWTQCSDCHVGMTIDFDFYNTFWNDDYYKGWDGIFFATIY